MALNLEQKEAIVTKLSGIVQHSVSAVAAEYRGLTVAQMTKLRHSARKAGVVVGIYRNTLARKAVEDTAFACLKEAMVGPIMLLFSQDEPGAAAKLLQDFVKEHENFVVRALALEGKLFNATHLKAVASLPSRHEALTQLAIVAQAPIVKLARTLNETVAQLVRVFAAIADKKKA